MFSDTHLEESEKSGSSFLCYQVFSLLLKSNLYLDFIKMFQWNIYEKDNLLHTKFLTFYEIYCVSQQKSKEKIYTFSVSTKA